MREFTHGIRLGRVAVALVTLGASLGVTGPVAATSPDGLEGLRTCPPGAPGRVRVAARPPRLHLEGRVDPTGTLSGTVLRMDGTVIARLGTTAFADGPFGRTAIVGERALRTTRMALLDLWRGCVTRRLTLPSLVYGSHLDPVTRAVHVSLVEPGTRRELGIWQVDRTVPARARLVVAPPSGPLATVALRSGSIAWNGGPVGRWCAADVCEERGPSGRVLRSVVEPDTGDTDADGIDTGSGAITSRPVPEDPAPRWPKGTELTYRWHAGETPPTWLRAAVKAAAADLDHSSRSRVPSVTHDASASDAIRYTTSFPAPSCATAIACASFVIGASWTIRFRPHGTDFRWGTLRWCEADDRHGCFDAERVTLHELGHVMGLDDPESAGFSLRPYDTVMHQLSPATPRAGSRMHAVGPCDTATLQERYDVPGPASAISDCNDVATVLSLAVSDTEVTRRAPVTLVAELRIPDRDGYGRLGGNALADRSVQLRRRPLGATNTAWTVFWMRPGDDPATYVSSFRPSVSYEFQAAFVAPESEGLRDSATPIVRVRVVDGCGVSPCVEMEDPMS